MRLPNWLNQLRQELRRASDADPRRHSCATSANRLQSLAFALAGCAYMLRHQKNVRIILIATLAVLAAALWLNIDSQSWPALVLAIALVWIAEFLNGAIEATVDLVSQSRHPLARTAKDTAAAAVLLSSLAAALVGALLLGPPLIKKLDAVVVWLAF